MKNSLLGLILTVAGMVIVLMAAGQFILRALIALVGLYLIHKGMMVQGGTRRHSSVTFYRFWDRF